MGTAAARGKYEEELGADAPRGNKSISIRKSRESSVSDLFLRMDSRAGIVGIVSDPVKSMGRTSSLFPVHKYFMKI
jgi:hypothetical protein